MSDHDRTKEARIDGARLRKLRYANSLLARVNQEDGEIRQAMNEVSDVMLSFVDGGDSLVREGQEDRDDAEIQCLQKLFGAIDDAVADARDTLLGEAEPDKPKTRRMGDLIGDLLSKEAACRGTGLVREYWICVGGDYYDDHARHWANGRDKWYVRASDVKVADYGMTYDAVSYSDDVEKTFITVTGEWFDHVQARRHEEA